MKVELDHSLPGRLASKAVPHWGNQTWVCVVYDRYTEQAEARCRHNHGSQSAANRCADEIRPWLDGPL